MKLVKSYGVTGAWHPEWLDECFPATPENLAALEKLTALYNEIEAIEAKMEEVFALFSKDSTQPEAL